MSEYPSITSDDKLWSALSYVFAPIVGIIVLLLEDKKSRPFIKYHAVQSIAISVVVFLLSIIITTITFGFGGLCVPLAWLVFLLLGIQGLSGRICTDPLGKRLHQEARLGVMLSK